MSPNEDRCPSCDEAALEMRTFIKATVVIDGQRRPAAWSFVECRACTVRWKRWLDPSPSGQPEWNRPTDEEWARHCSGDS